MLKNSIFPGAARLGRFDLRRSNSRFGGRRKRRCATVIVETAMCMTLVLLPLSLGTLQFGVILSSGNQLEQVSREGARYAAVHAFDTDFTGNDSTKGSLRYYLKNLVVAQHTAIPWTDLDGATRTAYSDANPAPSKKSLVLDGFVQIIYANGITYHPNAKGESVRDDIPLTPVVGTPVAGESVSVRIVYPMARKLFLGNFTFNGATPLPALSRDYVVTSTFVVE